MMILIMLIILIMMMMMRWRRRKKEEEGENNSDDNDDDDESDGLSAVPYRRLQELLSLHHVGGGRPSVPQKGVRDGGEQRGYISFLTNTRMDKADLHVTFGCKSSNSVGVIRGQTYRD